MDFIDRTISLSYLLEKLAAQRESGKKLEFSLSEDIGTFLNNKLEELRDQGDHKESLIEYLILLAPLSIAILYGLFYSELKLLMAVFLVLLISYLLYANFKMKDLIQQNHGLKWKEEFKNNAALFLQSKILYLKSAIRIKYTRFWLIRIFYLVFFPILLFSTYYLINNSWAFDNVQIFIILCLLIGSPYWVWYFQKRMEPVLTELHSIQRLEDNFILLQSGVSSEEEE